MKNSTNIIRVTLCGPSDVEKEIAIANEIIAEWNQLHWDRTGCGLKTSYWKTDAIPTMAERGQAAINHQMIDDSDILVAIFWKRIGTPTGLADSGTVEEIERAMARDIRVLAYFSDLESPSGSYDRHQEERLMAFRESMMAVGLPFTFKNKRLFRDMFKSHLDAAVHEILSTQKNESRPRKSAKDITQKAEGNGNFQIAGDGNTLHIRGFSPKRPKVTVERSPDHIPPADQKRVSDWIKELAEESTGKPIGELIQEWWGRFYSRFEMASYKELEIGQMPEVKAWHQQQLNLTKENRKTTDPKSWRTAKYRSIKMKMSKTGRTKEDYYPELSSRLNMKKPFSSLTKLSKHDLGRVERMVSYDYKKWL